MFEVIILGIVSGIGSNVIYAFYASKKKQKYYSELDESRKLFLKGKWKGVVSQANGPWGEEFINYEICLNIEVKGKKLYGIMETSYTGEQGSFNPKFTFEGYIKHSRFLNFDYQESELAEVHYGSMMLRIPDYTKSNLKGSFLHYGAISEEIVTGDVTLEKCT